MSLEKTIKEHLMGESADFADEDEYRHHLAHHRTKGHVHDSHAELYRDDTEDGRTLKNYHTTRALLHRAVAHAVENLLVHVGRKDHHPAKDFNNVSVTSPGQMS